MDASNNKGASVLFLSILGLGFLLLTVVFLFFPRSTYSELEKRDLATFPPVENLKKNPAQFTADVSTWFSDSEPYRDRFMTLSMTLRDAFRVNFSSPEDAVTIIPSATPVAVGDISGDPSAEAPVGDDGFQLDDKAKVANSDIIIVGSGENVRALMTFHGTPSMVAGYVETVNEYARAFPGVNVYAMVVPLASEYYLPEKVKNKSKPQLPVLEYVRDNIDPAVKFVDVNAALLPHRSEAIYSRTDHHWAPLGAYYAAGALAKAAGVPFKGLDSYEQNVIHNYVGSMYGYSKDISVKNAPEDFIYYIPKGLDLETTYITFTLDKDFNIISESAPYKKNFFQKFKDGTGMAYLTFMGGDMNIVKVKTGTPGNRRLLIIKDSFGNAIPSNLFFSFSEVHIVDFRYFPKNMREYVEANGITDIVPVFNVFNAVSSRTQKKVRDFITQPSGIRRKPAADSPSPVETPDPVRNEETAPTPVEPAPSTAAPSESSPSEPAPSSEN